MNKHHWYTGTWSLNNASFFVTHIRVNEIKITEKNHMKKLSKKSISQCYENSKFYFFHCFVFV